MQSCRGRAQITRIDWRRRDRDERACLIWCLGCRGQKSQDYVVLLRQNAWIICCCRCMGQNNQDYTALWRYRAEESGLYSSVQVWGEIIRIV